LEKTSNLLNQSNSINELSGQNPGKRLCIYIGESDRWRGKPLDTAILETLKSLGLAGATVFRGTSGFGAHSHIRTSSIEVLSVDLPILIEAVDTPERIQTGLNAISPMMNEGLITLEDVTIVKYTHRYLNPLPADRMVGEVMTTEVVSLTETLSIREAWEKMIQNELKALPVIDSCGRVTGILTDEDLLERAGIRQRLSVTLQLTNTSIQEDLKELDTSNLRVKDVMTHPVLTIKRSDSLGFAVSKMVQAGLKRLPVVDDTGCLVGMLSRLDILKQVADSPASNLHSHLPAGIAKTVEDIMRVDIPAVHMNEKLPSIVNKFAGSNTHRLLVIDGSGKAAGLIADSDVVARVQPEYHHGILKALRNFGKPPAGRETASDIMSPGVTAISPDTPITDAVRLMLEEGRKWLVVTDKNEKPIGIVDRRALLEAVSSLH